MRDGANESTATPPPGSSRERQPAVTGDQAVPEPEPACGADLDRDEVAALRAILEGTARSTGAVFFQTLVRHLASALGVSYAFVAEFAGAPTRVRTLAYWGRGRIQREPRIRAGRDSLRGRRARGAVPPSPGGPGAVPGRPAARRPGDRELPGRAAARRRGPGARPPGGLRRAAHARRAPAALHLPDLRHPGRRRARAAAGRAAARGERAALSRALRGGTQRLRGDRRRSTAPERQPPRHPIARRAGVRAGGPARAGATSPRRRPGRPRAEEALPRGFAGREISGWELEMRRRDGDAAVGQRVDEAAPRGRRPDSRRAFDLGRHHRPGARRGRARPPPAAEPLPPGRAQVGPQLRGDRRPIPRAAGRARQGQPGGADRRHGAHHRRDRDRQGADRPGDPLAQPAARPSR